MFITVNEIILIMHVKACISFLQIHLLTKDTQRQKLITQKMMNAFGILTLTGESIKINGKLNSD